MDPPLARNTQAWIKERDHALIEYVWQNPESSLQEIGDAFGVSRVRAFQILKKTGKKKNCWNCYHYIGEGKCFCRNSEDIVNPCRDWHPRTSPDE